MDDEIDRKIDVTATLFLLVQNRHQTHDLTLIGSGANELGIQEWSIAREETQVNLLSTNSSTYSSNLILTKNSQYGV